MSIEAMKQALEALEDATKHIFLGDKNGVEANIRAHKQCESLRQAIAEEEKQEPVAFIDEQGTLRYYKPSDFNQCEYGGLVRLYKEKT